MPPTPFPAGKTIKELGIDTTRKFVVVKPDGESIKNGLKVGDIGRLPNESSKNSSIVCLYVIESGQHHYCYISELAYYEPTKLDAWEPKEGDLVAVKGQIIAVNKDRSVHVSIGDGRMFSVPPQTLSLVSRPTRKVTMKEVEQAMGGPVEIVD